MPAARRLAGAALGLVLLAASNAPTRAQTLNPYGRDFDLVVPIREGGRLLGTIPLRLGADDSLSVEAGPYVALLGDLLTDEARAGLLAAADAEGRVGPAASAAAGLPLAYDPGMLELVLTVPAALRPTTEIALRRFGEPPIGAVEAPAAVSGFVNLRGGIDYVSKGSDEGLGAPVIDVDAAMRALGVVLEAQAIVDLDDDAAATFQRRDVRLVKDFPASAHRLALGDVRPLSIGFQTSPRLLGVTLERAYADLQPYRSVIPQGQRRFTLERPANVDVLINGLLVERLRLDPGTYDLRNFPFARGANDIVLVIQDDAGGVDRISFTSFFDGALLASGIDEYAISAGVTSDLEDGSITYGGGDPVLSSFYRRGLSDDITAGANAQSDGETTLIGAEALTATRAGVFETEAAVSVGDAQGYAVNLDWEFPFANRPPNSANRYLGASIEHRSEEFAAIGSFGGVATDFDLSLRYGQDLPLGLRGALGASYGMGSGDNADQYGVSLGLSRQIGSRASVTTSFSYDDDGREDDLRAFVGVTFALDRRQRVSASFDSADNGVRADYSLIDTGRLGGYGVAVGVERGEDDSAIDAAAAFTGNRVDLSASHDTRFDGLVGDMTSQSTRVSAGTSLVFADGAFGVTRAVGDSFAILTPHPTLEGRTIYVDPSRDGDAGSSGPLGPAVQGGLRSYYNQRVSYDVDDLPLGYDLGKGVFEMNPPYKSGYRLTVGSAATVTATGTLQDRDGEPLPLAVGTVEALDDPDFPAMQIFTNRAGRFGLQGLKPGRYEVAFADQGGAAFTVPDGTVGLFRAGSLTVGGGG